MRWSERQREMLREMGVRLWDRDGAAPASAPMPSGTLLAERETTIETPRPAPAAVPVAPAALQGEAEAARIDVEAVPADWLVVGEPLDAAAAAPALAGDPERLLAHMLHAVRVSRDAPARSGRACHLVLGSGGAAQVEQALSRVAPRVVLALGRAAAEAVLGVDEPLGRLRGVVHERSGLKVVVTFALAYLLRHPGEKAKAWADLCLAVRALEAGAG